jgi:Polyketide cyclase / dehydrase and lipid transport
MPLDKGGAMASIHKEVLLEVAPEVVWDVVRDVGAVHTRFARDFVVDTRLEGRARVVTFANGFVAREQIVDVDDAARRLVYSASSPRLTHHNASFQVFADGNRGTRLVWIADLLPDESAGVVEGMMTQGVEAIRKTIVPTTTMAR